MCIFLFFFNFLKILMRVCGIDGKWGGILIVTSSGVIYVSNYWGLVCLM